MTILELLQQNGRYVRNKYGGTMLFPSVACKDGTLFSIQASKYHLCDPQETLEEDDISEYVALEVYCHDETDSKLKNYSDGYVCSRVPVDVIDEVLKLHGGIISG